MLKILLFTFCLLFIVASSSNIAIYPTKVGDSLEFDFGRGIKELQVIRDLGKGVEKLLPSDDLKDSVNKGDKSQLPTNAILTREGLLVIDPVTEEDYGTYKSDVLYGPRFGYPILQIVPLPLSTNDITEGPTDYKKD
uniref:Secreted protein n=1 Tax=Strongyloides papillosus TaxID=174720 RepID=A0A0N5C5X4_STREA